MIRENFQSALFCHGQQFRICLTGIDAAEKQIQIFAVSMQLRNDFLRNVQCIAGNGARLVCFPSVDHFIVPEVQGQRSVIFLFGFHHFSSPSIFAILL